MTVSVGLGLLGGWLLDAATGDPRRGHPVAGYGRVAAALERRMHRDDVVAGGLYAGLLVGVPTGMAALAERRLRSGRPVLLAVLTWAALGGRSLAREAGHVTAPLADGNLSEARRRLPALVGRDPSQLDADGVRRAVMESVAENTADAVVGPLVWGAVAGPAGVVAHRCANTLDAMVGHRTVRHRRFGTAAARLDDVLGWAPARVTTGLTVLLAPLVGGSLGGAAEVVRADGHRSPSPNAGRCEAAFAGALGVGLGGRIAYAERVEVRGPYGVGAPPTADDVDRAVRLSRAVGLAAALLCCAALAGRRDR